MRISWQNCVQPDDRRVSLNILIENGRFPPIICINPSVGHFLSISLSVRHSACFPQSAWLHLFFWLLFFSASRALFACFLSAILGCLFLSDIPACSILLAFVSVSICLSTVVRMLPQCSICLYTYVYSCLDTAQPDKQLSRTVLWDIGTFFETPDN